jgi:hypothetical protein
MPTTPWSFVLNNVTDFTTSILSASITQGREKYLDNYFGGLISITINNNTNLANSFNFNDKIYVENVNIVTGFRDVFTVQEITYDDHPGNTGLSTATIFATDALSRSGRYQAIGKALTQTSTTTQMQQFNGSRKQTFWATLLVQPPAPSPRQTLAFTATVTSVLQTLLLALKHYLTPWQTI